MLRTARFFPEADDRDEVRSAYADANVKINELLHRRVDLQDVVDAHRLALQRAPQIGLGRFVLSATTPFLPAELGELRTDAAAVLRRRFPHHEAAYDRLGWRMFPSIERVHVNTRARNELGWTPRHDFGHALERLAAGEDPRSPLAIAVGAKGYHCTPTGPYTPR